MATWHKATREPVTTEREVKVYDAAGREGYVSVSWETGRTHAPRFFGPVYAVQRHFDSEGAEIAEPTTPRSTPTRPLRETPRPQECQAVTPDPLLAAHLDKMVDDICRSFGVPAHILRGTPDVSDPCRG